MFSRSIRKNPKKYLFYLSFSVFSTSLPKVLSPWINSSKSTSPLPSLSNTSAKTKPNKNPIDPPTHFIYFQHLQLSSQADCSGVLESREAPEGSTFQSYPSQACGTFGDVFNCVAPMVPPCWTLVTEHIDNFITFCSDA